MNLPDPKDFGAETKTDIGVFLLGGALGGGLDAIFNVAPFAEPFVFAGICASGALGAKKLIDGWLASRSSGPSNLDDKDT